MNSLLKADEMKLRSLALPAISSGIFGFPKERCAQIMIETALNFFAEHPESAVLEVRFTNIDAYTVGLFKAQLETVDLE